MTLLLTVLGVLVALLSIATAVYLLTARPYQSSTSVSTSYDEWTEDGILEFYWGEHIHLGHYGSPPRQKDFLAAKADFVHEMVRWADWSNCLRARLYWMLAVELEGVAEFWRGTMALR